MKLSTPNFFFYSLLLKEITNSISSSVFKISSSFLYIRVILKFVLLLKKKENCLRKVQLESGSEEMTNSECSPALPVLLGKMLLLPESMSPF